MKIGIKLLVEVLCEDCNKLTEHIVTADWPWINCGHCGKSATKEDLEEVKKYFTSGKAFEDCKLQETKEHPLETLGKVVHNEM